MLQPAGAERPLQVMDTISDEAEERGLTDEMPASELAAYSAERRDRLARRVIPLKP